MKNIFYQVDAFTSGLFSGNPAAVCPLESWLEDEVMQKLAIENNLSETAFFIRTPRGYHVRWFTPQCEMKLCGHATLAAAYVLWNHLDEKRDVLEFDSLSGKLIVTREGDWIKLDFPQSLAHECVKPRFLEEGLGIVVNKVFKADDYIVLLENEKAVKRVEPFFEELIKVQSRGIIVTAIGDDCDFVSRYFAPASGINEDPVTGSAHTQLIPFWAQRLGKLTMNAKQISKRGGFLKCALNGDRVYISGQAKLYLRGEYYLS